MMRQFKEGVDYNYLIPDNEETTVGIKLLTGKYSDTVFHYGKVKFEEEKTGDIYLRFIYNILNTPLDKKELEESSEFKNYIGDLLVCIMEQNISKGLIDEAGTNYSEESDTE